MAFDHSSLRWFEANSCKSAPRGLSSSLAQLHAMTDEKKTTTWSHSWRTMLSVTQVQASPLFYDMLLLKNGTLLSLRGFHLMAEPSTHNFRLILFLIGEGDKFGRVMDTLSGHKMT
jgi:hypothetical protein